VRLYLPARTGIMLVRGFWKFVTFS
jgi:hypothetical protein